MQDANATPGNHRYTILHIDHDLAGLARFRGSFGAVAHLRGFSSPCPLIGLEIARFRRPDLILVDVDSPEIDAYELLAKLRRDPRTRHIATLAVCADPPAKRRRALLATGFDGIIDKPLSASKALRAAGIVMS